jgi:hypothetical protein
VRQAHGWSARAAQARRGRREREARMQDERCIFYARALNKLAMKKRRGNNKAAGRRWQFVWFSGDGGAAGLRAPRAEWVLCARTKFCVTTAMGQTRPTKVNTTKGQWGEGRRGGKG